LAEIDDVSAVRDLDLRFGADFRDPIAHDQHHRPGEQFSGFAVKELAGSKGSQPGRRWTFVITNVRRSDAWCGADTAPLGLKHEKCSEK